MGDTELASARADRAVTASRQMYARMLASWASDMLALRRRSLHQPGRRVYGAGVRVRRAA
jgi:hypothetical protein